MNLSLHKVTSIKLSEISVLDSASGPFAQRYIIITTQNGEQLEIAVFTEADTKSNLMVQA